jgi:multicomponent Na+:H+ antiporter subunit E
MRQKPARGELGLRVLHQLPLLIALVLLWMALWGNASWLTLVSGAIVAIFVNRFFYLPPVELSGRLNPGWGVLFLIRFFRDVVVASFQVAWFAVRPRQIPRSSVVAVQLRTRSDLIMTLCAIAVSLVPGSLILEADRERSILYLHAFATERPEDVENVRRTVLLTEQRIVLAIGSREDVWRINRVRTATGQRSIAASRQQRDYERDRERSAAQQLQRKRGA